MNTSAYDRGAEAAKATPPGEHIPGPPTGGLLFLWIGILVLVAIVLFFGGAIFMGILQAVG